MNEQAYARRIGIFQADWPLQSQTANCAFMLARAGYEVDLFLSNVMQYYDIRSSTEFQENLRIHLYTFGIGDQGLYSPFTPYGNETFAEKINAFIVMIFRCAGSILGRKSSLMNGSVISKSTSSVQGNKYTFFIGIEKKGLIWAGILGDRFNIPYGYYSLELYTRDHPDAMTTYLDRQIKAAEEAFHKKAVLTIVQDADRADVLFKDNGIVKKSLTFYVPVSLLGSPHRGKSSFFHDRYHLSPEQIIVLQFGLFYDRRFSLELIDVARLFPWNWTLVLHGYSLSESYQRQIERKCHDRVILSDHPVPSSQIRNVIASADIGLVFYTSETKNDFMTAFSSEKLALFLQQGKPIIAFDYPGYRRLMGECDCGVLIRSLSELPTAVETVLADWERYSINAIRAFQLHYDYSKNFMPVINRINEGFD